MTEKYHPILFGGMWADLTVRDQGSSNRRKRPALSHVARVPSPVRPRRFDHERIRGVKVVFLSEEDVLDDHDILTQLRLQTPTVVLTRGDRGSVVFQGDTSIVTPALSTDVVDPTGAGDAYAAAFLTALLGGATKETAAETGVRAAATIISYVGWEGVKHLQG